MNHWARHARSWSLIGQPLRPCPEDTRIVEAEVAAIADGRAVNALVLGVTPELVGLPLPSGSTVVAIDREPVMIDLLFEPAADRRAIVGDWRTMPLPDASIDIALGDGCVTLFAYDELHAFAAELARVIRPGGVLVLRLFAALASESLDAVRAELSSFGSFHALKWRIAMAIQSPRRGIAVTAIRDAFNDLVPDRAALVERTGWSRDVVDHIDSYVGSPAVYSFPTIDEVRAVFAPLFTEIACHVPSYELGERCPTLVFQSSTTASPASL